MLPASPRSASVSIAILTAVTLALLVLTTAAPVATGEGVFVADDRTLVLYDGETGDRRRELRSFGDGADAAPRTVAVDDGTAFVTSASGVVALDAETGTARWRRDVRVSHSGGICVGTETVVLPVDDPAFAPGTKTISAFDRESAHLDRVLDSSEPLWIVPADSTTNANSPVVETE